MSSSGVLGGYRPIAASAPTHALANTALPPLTAPPTRPPWPGQPARPLRRGSGEPFLLRLVVHRMPSRLRLHRLQPVGELAGGPGELAHEPHHEPLPTRKRRNVEHPSNRIEVNRERQPTGRDLHHRGSS